MRILVVSGRVPRPHGQGDQTRMFGVLEELAGRHEITVVTSRSPKPEDAETLRPVAELVAPPFRNRHASIVGYTNFRVPPEVKNDSFRRMCEHAAAGELRVEHEAIPLEEVASAWERQAASPSRKLVLTI